jgi:hypothetical protein
LRAQELLRKLDAASMRTKSRLPDRQARRLRPTMAQHATRRHRPSGPPAGAPRWSSQQIADALVPRRDRFVTEINRELPMARGLTVDQCELVVDEAIDYLVTEYRRPIDCGDEVGASDPAVFLARASRVGAIQRDEGCNVPSERSCSTTVIVRLKAPR